MQQGFAHKCMLLAPKKLANTAAVMSIRNEVTVCVCVHVHECVCTCMHVRMHVCMHMQSALLSRPYTLIPKVGSVLVTM